MDDVDYSNEIWETIPFAPEYLASDFGRIKRKGLDRSNREPRILKPKVTKSGYESVGLTTGDRVKHFRVNVCVLSAFKGLRPGDRFQCAHRDNKRRNNRPGNLRWALPVENMADQVEHGTRPKGSDHSNAKLDEQDVQIIRDLFDLNALSTFELSSLYGVNLKTMYAVCYRKSWKHVADY